MAVISVLTASTSLLSASVRSKILISNRGLNTIWCIFNATAVVNSGFPVDPGQREALEVNKSDINGDLNAIAETGSTVVSVYEIA